MTLLTTSNWAAPRLSMRWVPVFRRNFLVWRKLAIPSLVGNIAEPLITLVAFGYGLGVLIGAVNLNGAAIPYILFLASGSICTSAMNAASFEALYSAFSRMHVQRTWDGIMNAPVRLDDVVFAIGRRGQPEPDGLFLNPITNGKDFGFVLRKPKG
jgi:lipooligosaccharide transport system permease protein